MSSALQCGHWEDAIVNPRLVTCLLASVPFAGLAGFLGIFAGLGWVAAFALYCVAGSVALVGTAVALDRVGAAPRPVAVRVPARVSR